MSKYLLIAVGVLSLLLIGSGYALKKSIQVEAEARQAVKERDAALAEALEQKKASEAAVASRDEKLIQINSENRRYKYALKEALANDDCAGKPVPAELNRLLHHAPETSKNMPARYPVAVQTGS